MPRTARAYLSFILLTGLVMGVWAASTLVYLPNDWTAFGVLVFLSTAAQLSKSWFDGREKRETSSVWYSPVLVFLSAGVFLVSPSQFVMLVVFPHAIEWLREYWVRRPNRPFAYVQPFNIASHLIVGLVTQAVYLGLSSRESVVNAVVPIIAGSITVLLYLVLNHLILGNLLMLARGLSWNETDLFNIDALISDGIMLTMGYAFALLWRQNPLLALPALAPLVLLQQALLVPQLRKQASIDAKTGLYNAGHFNTLFNAELKRAKRFSRPMALLVADLDLLRNINNNFGHLAGDAVLSGLGQIIRDSIREYDIVGRFGGEEFVIAMPESGIEEARTLAERMRLAVEATPFRTPTVSAPIHATISFGIACFPDEATDATELIHQADIAVYQAKVEGRNRVVCISDLPYSVRHAKAIPVEHSLERDTGHILPRIFVPDAAADIDMRRSTDDAPLAGPQIYSERTNGFLMGLVITLAIAISVAGLLMGPWPDLQTLAIITSLVVVFEFLEVKIYGGTTFSVSPGVRFAAAVLLSIPGVVFVSAGLVLATLY